MSRLDTLGDTPASERASVGGELFFEHYQEPLKDVFSIVGLPSRAIKSLHTAVEMTQPWVQGDHSRPGYKWDLSDDQQQALRAQYGRLGMVHERGFPKGHYDQLIVLGAIHAGNMRRAEFVGRMLEQGGVTADQLILLGGQRRIYQERETDDILDNLAQIDVKDHGGAWVEGFRADMDDNGAATRWETDFIRLAAVAHLGPLALRQLHMRLQTDDPIRRYEFTASSGLPVSLLHTAAVPRPNGEPRHTTEACIEDWIKTYQPTNGSRVGMVGANPHAARMVRSAGAVLDRVGRDDINLVLGTPAAPEGIRDSIYLGEIARSLYEDQRQFARAA